MHSFAYVSKEIVGVRIFEMKRSSLLEKDLNCKCSSKVAPFRCNRNKPPPLVVVFDFTRRGVARQQKTHLRLSPDAGFSGSY